MMGHVLFQGEIIKKLRKYIDEIKKKPILQNHWANFNQTWRKASLDEVDLSLFQRRTNTCVYYHKVNNGFFLLINIMI